MAEYRDVSVTITNAGGGMVNIIVGQETYTLPVHRIRAFFRRENDPLIGLLIQIGHALDAAGIDPQTNLAAAKVAIEAKTYRY